MTMTFHAACRMNERGLTEEAVLRVVERGKRLKAEGGRVKFVLNGTVVIMSQDGALITAYDGCHNKLLKVA
jgi:hypothetical protein